MILLVSDEPALLFTRAIMLGEWGCTAVSIADAAGTVCNRDYNLLIFCQTVPDTVAAKLLAIARKCNADVKVLTILPVGCPFAGSYDSATYMVNFADPGRLRDVVAQVLRPGSDKDRPGLSLLPPSRDNGQLLNAVGT